MSRGVSSSDDGGGGREIYVESRERVREERRLRDGFFRTVPLVGVRSMEEAGRRTKRTTEPADYETKLIF